jgi:hypothetical protein
MPRKQRFKPSRKPKPIPNPEIGNRPEGHQEGVPVEPDVRAPAAGEPIEKTGSPPSR